MYAHYGFSRTLATVCSFVLVHFFGIGLLVSTTLWCVFSRFPPLPSPLLELDQTQRLGECSQGSVEPVPATCDARPRDRSKSRVVRFVSSVLSFPEQITTRFSPPLAWARGSMESAYGIACTESTLPPAAGPTRSTSTPTRSSPSSSNCTSPNCCSPPS